MREAPYIYIYIYQLTQSAQLRNLDKRPCPSTPQRRKPTPLVPRHTRLLTIICFAPWIKSFWLHFDAQEGNFINIVVQDTAGTSPCQHLGCAGCSLWQPDLSKIESRADLRQISIHREGLAAPSTRPRDTIGGVSGGKEEHIGKQIIFSHAQGQLNRKNQRVLNNSHE